MRQSFALRSLAVVAVVFALLLSILPSAPVRAEVLLAPQAGYVPAGLWTAFDFPVKQGTLYEFTLRPQDSDADLYLYRDAVALEYSIASGTEVDQVRWRADRDGAVTAWVYGLKVGTAFEIAANSVRETNGKRVGLQVGHWRAWEPGYPFKGNTGASGGGKTEPEVNLAIAQHTAALLEAEGYTVDLLPAAMPTNYKADAVVAIHADGASSTSRRGFFTDKPTRSDVSAQEARLSQLIDDEYADATGLTRVFRGTANTRSYYGYSRVAESTPMIIIETGFLTSPADREIIVGRPDLAARGIANGIDRFLSQ